MADMPATNDDSTDSTATDSDLQVDLGPDDLKKAQVQTAHAEMRETSSRLRVPGIVNADEYKEVHVTPLVGGIIRVLSARMHDLRGSALISSSVA